MIYALVVAGYALVPLVGLALAVTARVKPQSLAGPGELLAWVFATRSARLTVFLFLWWLGWHFLVPD
ncbi:DUF6186 family protein [Specibacter sp. RAF43]|uniref:DUF6186 family protein n=1 Tax=Specibacter sp. RAF43 TaxID=3233057 RepID=UPI003F980AE4